MIELGVAEWGLQEQSGDAYVAQPFEGGTLVAVIDGLGHGPAAAVAASAAKGALAAHAGDPPATLLRRCHEALQSTRGAVVSLASVKATGTLVWAGVGNVQAALLASLAGSQPRLLTARGGILGYDLPAARGATEPISRGDMLVFTTDGVRPESLIVADHGASAQENAERILYAGRTRRDDALVLVARYRGEPG